MRQETASIRARTVAAFVLAFVFLLALASAPSAALAACGDGALDGNELCDVGPDVAGDCCDPDCNFVGGEVSCTDDGNTCTLDFCDGQGTCLHVPGGGTCDDGNDCTVGDFCGQFGECLSEGAQQNGASCSDAALCGGGGSCQDGFCAGDPADCSEIAFECQVGTCNAELRLCEFRTADDGTACGFANACYDLGKCETGECIPSPKDCSAFADDCNYAACDVELPGGCYSSPKQDGTTCDDGNGCTVQDTCTYGTCDGSTRDCSGLTDACHTGYCNGDLGDCAAETLPDGTSCNDGNACTSSDQCGSGACGGTPTDCSGLGDACNDGVCDPQTGSCQATAAEDGRPCDDGNACTTGDACSGGECFGAPLDCSSADDACNVGFCNPDSGQCEKQPTDSTGPCDDGNACTTGDACEAGACVGTPTDCSASGDACNTGVCNSQTGSCAKQPVEDRTTCNDGNACTSRDQCTGGACAGTPADCSAFDDACNVGSCDPETGSCASAPKAGTPPCNDGNACTTDDACLAGECNGTPTDCSASTDACNNGFCNGDTGGCEQQPVENGSPCDDGNACTSGDQCTAGACAGAALDCSGLDAPCQTGRCNPQGGQCETVAAGDGTPCNDQAFCTATDTCVGGVCTGAGDPCAGGAECATTCNEAGDHCFTTVGAACSSDANPCTDDACNGEGSCVHVANSDACDDGLFCTSGDTCADGECGGQPTCPQAQGCGDTCNEAEDACRTCGHPFSEQRCVVNAIFVLQAAVGLRDCELCTCDVDASGAINTSDALRILRTCVNLPVTLTCPEPSASTTSTTTPAVTSTTMIP